MVPFAVGALSTPSGYSAPGKDSCVSWGLSPSCICLAADPRDQACMSIIAMIVRSPQERPSETNGHLDDLRPELAHVSIEEDAAGGV
ncbi:hypothetical protein VTK56DRAFT_4872 [Thermocarpiscus australiensis]